MPAKLSTAPDEPEATAAKLDAGLAVAKAGIEEEPLPDDGGFEAEFFLLLLLVVDDLVACWFPLPVDFVGTVVGAADTAADAIAGALKFGDLDGAISLVLVLLTTEACGGATGCCWPEDWLCCKIFICCLPTISAISLSGQEITVWIHA